jgi:hypothetical protein
MKNQKNVGKNPQGTQNTKVVVPEVIPEVVVVPEVKTPEQIAQEEEIKKVLDTNTPPANEIVIPEETYKQIADDLNSGAVTKSEWIRRLLKMGVKRGKICKILEVQYPMVLGVEKRMNEQKDKPEKVKEDLPVDIATASKTRIEGGTSKSEVIRDLLKAGYGRAAISRGINVPYPMVMGVEKRMNEVKPVDMDGIKAQIDKCTEDQIVELLAYTDQKLAEIIAKGGETTHE